MEALGINLGYLIMQILIITVMMLLLKGLVYKPIIKNLEERKARIAKGMEDSRRRSWTKRARKLCAFARKL